MRYFQELINNKIAVTFENEDEQMLFAKLCEKNNVNWPLSGKATRVPHSFIFANVCENKKLGYQSKEFYENKLYEIVPASEFLQPQTTIEIFQSKQTVVCLKKQDGKVIARGVARCSNDDVFNFDYGAELALNRMLENSKKKEFSKTINELGKKIAASFSAASAGLCSVNPAIKAASEEQERIIKESLIKSDHIQSDAVDAILPKVKTLKDGTKIIKQESYEVGDLILLKKNGTGLSSFGWGNMKSFSGKNVLIKEVHEDGDFKIDGCLYWFRTQHVEGKVIE